MANRIQIEVTMKSVYSYDAVPYCGYGVEERRIYSMEDAEGNVYVWKTTAYMCLDDGAINKGDKITITASIKGIGEYKGQPQTEVTRVKVISRSFKAETWEEKQARLEKEREARAEAQRESLEDGDFIWKMPYRQYKEHYSDCETVEGSFEGGFPCTIEVIIRAGRLKESGVRGKRFWGYEISFVENGREEKSSFRAVCRENAMKQAKKAFPNATNFQFVSAFK